MTSFKISTWVQWRASFRSAERVAAFESLLHLKYQLLTRLSGLLVLKYHKDHQVQEGALSKTHSLHHNMSRPLQFLAATLAVVAAVQAHSGHGE